MLDVRLLRGGETMTSQTWSLCSAIVVSLVLSSCAAREQPVSPHSEPQPTVAITSTTDQEAEVDDPAVFREFWASFREAVHRGDRHQLYLLTRHSEFHWEPSDLGTPRHGDFNYFYRFQQFDDFDKAYPKIFTLAVQAKIHAEQPVPSHTRGYEIRWGDRRCRYTLMFNRDSDGVYRFAGALCGVP